MFRASSLRSALLAISLITGCLSTTFAQQRFSAGPRVGLNLSTLQGDINGYSLSPGLVAGGFLMYSSLNHFGISADLLYSQRGGKFTGNDRGTPYTFRQQVNYLEIPVALRYFLTLSGAFRPNIFFGPSLSLLLDAKRTNTKLGNVDQMGFGNSEQFNKADLGLLAGFQLNFPGFGQRQRFLIDARYTYGLADITVPITPSTPGIAGGTGVQNIRNSTISLTLGYGFGVGREHPSRYRK